MRRAVLLTFAVWLFGCAGDAGPEQPAPPTTPTADSRPASVEQLTDQLIGDMMADPPGWPSRSDYELVVLPFYHDSPDSIDDALADFDHYAAVYVAAECLAGRETTPARFRDLVGKTFSADRDRIPRIAAEAEAVIAGILAHEPQDAPPCLPPYITPSTAVEAISALRLARPVLAANRPPLLPWEIDAKVREIALSWFGRPESLFEWVCAHEHACNLLNPP